MQSSSVAVGVGTSDSMGVALGATFARNDVDANAKALIDNSGGGSGGTADTISGDVAVTAVRNGSIDALVTTTSVGVSVSTGTSVSVSGGGSFAFNNITGSSNAVVRNSTLNTLEEVDSGTGTGTFTPSYLGDVTVTTNDNTKIDANVRSISVLSLIHI